MYVMTPRKEKPSGNWGFSAPYYAAISFNTEYPDADTAHVWTTDGFEKNEINVRWKYVGQVPRQLFAACHDESNPPG